MIRIFRIIIFVWSLNLGCLYSAAQCQYHKQFSLIADSIVYKKIDNNIASVSIEARVKVLQNRERNGLSKSSWQLLWNYQSPNDYNYVELTWNNTNYGDILDIRQCVINIVEVNNGNHNCLKSVSLERGVNLSTGFNSILLEVEKTKYNVFVGEDNLKYLGSFPIDSIVGECGLSTSVNSFVSYFVIDAEKDIAKTLVTSNNAQTLRLKFESTTSLVEGFWSYLDRDNNPDWARLGGRYRLALVQDGDDYIIIYIGGAETNKKNWHEGMIKGRLKSTIFQNHYDLEWYDSMFDLICEDAYASIENSILTLEFPILKTQIRFFKE